MSCRRLTLQFTKLVKKFRDTIFYQNLAKSLSQLCAGRTVVCGGSSSTGLQISVKCYKTFWSRNYESKISLNNFNFQKSVFKLIKVQRSNNLLIIKSSGTDDNNNIRIELEKWWRLDILKISLKRFKDISL